MKLPRIVLFYFLFSFLSLSLTFAQTEPLTPYEINIRLRSMMPSNYKPQQVKAIECAMLECERQIRQPRCYCQCLNGKISSLMPDMVRWCYMKAGGY